MPELADFENCTGCKACENICPHRCIEMKTDVIGAVLPHIDTSCCTNCHACEKICPALNPVKVNYPQSAFAAWNNNEGERTHCASGGIASAIYSWVNSINGISIGAAVDKDWNVIIKVSGKKDEFGMFRNSKYCYSDPKEVYIQIRNHIKSGKIVVLIGLPCQIAGYKKTFGERDNVYYIDLVCHGVAPNSYLKQHINHIEQTFGVKAVEVSFRAPELGTSNYYFTLYNTFGKIVYSKRSGDGDLFNIAFHSGFSYRENCYHCHYAKAERCSDITLGDYHGLGALAPCSFSDENVSVILVNSDKGKLLLNQLSSLNLITTVQRPTEEPINGDLQLQRPTIKTIGRLDFEKYIYRYNGQFIPTIQKVLNLGVRRNICQKIKNLPKRIVKKLFRIIGIKL